MRIVEVVGLADDMERRKFSGGFVGRRPVQVVGVVAVFSVVVAVLFMILNWYVAPTNPSERKDLVLALAQILGGTALLSGLYFTWRALEVNREGQITERFTRAIDQLGSDSLEVRIGGIYALERIARDSERDHWPIMEVLTAYVRQHAAAEKQTIEGSIREGVVSRFPPPNPDIQAIMTVIQRRTHYFRHGEPEPLNLRETNLSGANLSGVNLSGASLLEAVLLGTNLIRANLTKAYLEGANLSGAALAEANLTKANLWKANLSRAVLTDAILSEVILSEADLSGPELPEQVYAGANLSGADLTKANLWKANLTKSPLAKANLSGAVLSEANLTKTILRGADLSGADLTKTILRGADLSGADLSGTRDLTQDQLEQATGDMHTQLPSHLKPPTHWGVKTDAQIEGA